MSRRLGLRAGGSVSRRDHAHTEFDRTFVSGHAGPRWLSSDGDAEVNVLASVRRLWRAGTPDFDEIGVRVETIRRLNRRMTAGMHASRHERTHRRSTALDGPVMDVSAWAAVVATPTVRFSAAAGWGRERPDAAVAKRFRHIRWWVRPGVSADLPWGITLGGSVEWRRTRFDSAFGPLTLSGRPRRDRSHVLRASVSKRDWTLAGFSPRFSLVNERRDSNTQGAAYNRTGGELSFVRQF